MKVLGYNGTENFKLVTHQMSISVRSMKKIFLASILFEMQGTYLFCLVTFGIQTKKSFTLSDFGLEEKTKNYIGGSWHPENHNR